MTKVIKEIKMMLSTCGLCQGDIAPPSRQFLPRFRPRKIPKTSETKLELLSIEAPSSTCLPGEKGCDISTTTETTTRTESTTMATTTTKTTPTLRDIVTHSKPTICLPGQPDCEQYKTCSVDKRSRRSHCKVSGREEVVIALFIRGHHMNASDLL